MDIEKYAQAYAQFFQTLNSEMKQSHYEQFFTSESYFEDPFHKVQGIENIYPIFTKMYELLYQPSFHVLEVVCAQDAITYIQWEFVYQRDANAPKESFIGVSRVLFFENGTVLSHIDYWDAATHIYEKVPLLGSILRFIKKRINADG